MSTAERLIGYPMLTLPDGVAEPWVAGQDWDMTGAARAFHRERHRWPGIRMKAMSGGFGAGKTVAFRSEGIFAGFRNMGQMGVLLEPTFPLIRDALAPMLNRGLEDFGLVRGVDWEFSKSEYIWRVLGGADEGGFTIIARPGVEWERIIALNLAWIGLDEPARMPREAFTMARTRVRVGVAQEVFLAGTPDVGSWYAALIKDPPEGMEVFYAPTEGNPWIDPSYVEGLRQEFDPKALEAYLHGKPVSMTGNAYHAFAATPWPSGNIKPWTYDPDRPLILAVDNNRDPLAAVLAQEDGRMLCCFDEVTLRGGSWSALAEKVHLSLGGVPPKGIILTGDPVLRGAVHDERTDWGAFESIRQQIRRVFGEEVRVHLDCPKAHPLVLDRLEAVNAALCSAAGERRLTVDPKCKQLLADFDQVALTADGDLDKRKDKMRTHWSDAIGYRVAFKWPSGKRRGPAPLTVAAFANPWRKVVA